MYSAIREAIGDKVKVRITSAARSTMSICKIGEIAVQSSETPILLQSMSTRTLKFLSHLFIPTNRNIMLHFNVSIDEWEFSLIGEVTSRFHEGSMYSYECTLSSDHVMRKAILSAMSQMIKKKNPSGDRIHALLQYRKSLNS